MLILLCEENKYEYLKKFELFYLRNSPLEPALVVAGAYVFSRIETPETRAIISINRKNLLLESLMVAAAASFSSSFLGEGGRVSVRAAYARKQSKFI